MEWPFQQVQGCGSAGARARARTCAGRPAFTLMEMLVAIAIILALAATTVPVVNALLRQTRMNNAMARLKVGLQQTQAVLADYQMTDRAGTYPAISNAKYTGMALVVRWDDPSQDYEVFYALSAQNATKTAAPTDYLVAVSDPTDPAGAAHCLGYGRFSDLEPMTLGTGMRVAGVRRKVGAATPETTSKLELLSYPSGLSGNPCCSSFAVCLDPTGVGIPPAQQIYVNLQDVPPSGGGASGAGGPWNIWSQVAYDDAAATTGANAATYQVPTSNPASGIGECFLTSLPVLIVYQDDTLPSTGNSPSGVAWRIPNAFGQMALNPAVDVNELLAQTKGRLVYLMTQGGSPLEF